MRELSCDIVVIREVRESVEGADGKKRLKGPELSLELIFPLIVCAECPRWRMRIKEGRSRKCREAQVLVKVCSDKGPGEAETKKRRGNRGGRK